MTNQINSKSFFYCYDYNLTEFLRFTKGIDYIIKAKHPKTNRLFTMFYRTKELTEAIEEWKKIN
jgi:3-deoxy-D-manno-octulosonic acid (KDO) 8-phosphate synthase